MMAGPTIAPTAATPAASALATAPADHPGRWIGGAVGTLLSLSLIAISMLLEAEEFRRGLTTLATLGLLGAPIGFVVGRQFYPQARGRGWQDAVLVGTGLGWLAPPLGAVEIVVGQLATAVESGSRVDSSWLVILMIAIPVSFIAVLVTMPIGIAWGLIVHAIPAALVTRLRVPAPFDRLGVRRALVLAALIVVVDHLPEGARP